jgi:hypothetical protein
MPQLSDSQLVVLTAACQRPDRSVFPVTAKLKGIAAGNVLKSLLKKQLIKEIRAKREDTAWRDDEQHGRMTLVVTPAVSRRSASTPRTRQRSPSLMWPPPRMPRRPPLRRAAGPQSRKSHPSVARAQTRSRRS